MDDEMRLIMKWVSRGVMLLLAVVATFSSMNSIDTGTVGVVQHFGATQSYVLSEGFNFTRPWPFANVIDVTIAVVNTKAKAPASSKDLQAVTAEVTVQWSVSPHLAPRLVRGFGYTDGVWSNGIMAPAIQEVVKSVSAQYTAEQLVAKRAEVKLKIEAGLEEFVRKTLRKKDCVGAIQIANVAVTNFEFSDEFDHAIEAKVKAEQEALKAVNEKTKRVTQAEAAAQEKKLAADAEAYKTEVESKARADAIKRESDALSANPNLIQLRATERWNGVLPTYTGGAVPFINLK